MARRKPKPHYVLRCRRCRDLRLEGEKFYRGLCPTCLELDKRKRRRETATRVLAKAKDAGTVERDGQTFQVSMLPPKRRGGSRIR